MKWYRIAAVLHVVAALLLGQALVFGILLLHAREEEWRPDMIYNYLFQFFNGGVGFICNALLAISISWHHKSNLFHWILACATLHALIWLSFCATRPLLFLSVYPYPFLLSLIACCFTWYWVIRRAKAERPAKDTIS